MLFCQTSHLPIAQMLPSDVNSFANRSYISAKNTNFAPLTKVDSAMTYYQLRRNALLYDFACIAIAMVVLYLANRQLLPLWALVVGALLAATCLIASLRCMIQARKIHRAQSVAPPSPVEGADAVPPAQSDSSHS